MFNHVEFEHQDYQELGLNTSIVYTNEGDIYKDEDIINFVVDWDTGEVVPYGDQLADQFSGYRIF